MTSRIQPVAPSFLPRVCLLLQPAHHLSSHHGGFGPHQTQYRNPPQYPAARPRVDEKHAPKIVSKIFHRSDVVHIDICRQVVSRKIAAQHCSLSVVSCARALSRQSGIQGKPKISRLPLRSVGTGADCQSFFSSHKTQIVSVDRAELTAPMSALALSSEHFKIATHSEKAPSNSATTIRWSSRVASTALNSMTSMFGRWSVMFYVGGLSHRHKYGVAS